MSDNDKYTIDLSDNNEMHYSNPLMAGRFKSSSDPEAAHIAFLFHNMDGNVEGACSCKGHQYTGNCKHIKALKDEYGA